MEYLIILAICSLSLALVSATDDGIRTTLDIPNIQPEFADGEEAEEMSDPTDTVEHIEQLDSEPTVTDIPKSNLGVEGSFGEPIEPEELEDVPKWLKPKYILIFVAVILVITLITYFIGERKLKKKEDNDAVNELLQ